MARSAGTSGADGGSPDKPFDITALEAAKVVERITGNAWATDAAGVFTYVTPAALAFFGISLDSLNATPAADVFGWRRVIHPDDYDAAAAAWRRCLETGDHYNVEHRMLRATGVYRWARSTGQPIRNGEGAILGWYGTVVDADPRSEPSERRAENVDDPLANRSAPNPLRSMGAVHPHDRPTVEQAAARAFFHGIPQVSSYRQLQADGS
jgi:PAS domain S-box-containing protein